MGQAMGVYASDTGGLLPWGAIQHDAPWTSSTLPNASNRENFWRWHYTLSEILSKPLLKDGLVRGLSPIFRDKDIIEGPEGRWVCHYTSNPRLMYQANEPDNLPAIFSGWSVQPIHPRDRVQRKVASVHRPAEVFVIWDAPQGLDWDHNAYELASSMDGWALYSTHGYCLDSPSPGVKYDRPIPPGFIGNNLDGRALQRQYNIDLVNIFSWQSHLRFRHKNNTMLAALCADGHVETRRVGEVMVKDICTNYK
jgi:hypothetical protein